MSCRHPQNASKWESVVAHSCNHVGNLHYKTIHGERVNCVAGWRECKSGSESVFKVPLAVMYELPPTQLSIVLDLSFSRSGMRDCSLLRYLQGRMNFSGIFRPACTEIFDLECVSDKKTNWGWKYLTAWVREEYQRMPWTSASPCLIASRRPSGTAFHWNGR